MLRQISMAALIIGVVAGSAFAQRVGDMVSPRRGSVQIYTNEVRELNEQAIATVSESEVMTVQEERRNHFRVRTISGVEGFVEKSAVTRAREARGGRGSSASRAFTFEAAEVQGYLDDPTPIYIIDMEGADSDPISLDRSFREALKVNVDRDMVERIAR